MCFTIIRALYFNGAAHGIQYAAEFGQQARLYAGTNNAATDSHSHLYARRCIFRAIEPQLERIRRAAMTEKAYRFSASAIDELNKHRGAPTPVEKTICFADGRPGCPAASAVRPDRLVNAYLTLDIVFGLTP